MTMACRTLITHSRRTKREGLKALIGGTLTTAGGITFFHVFCHFFFPQMRTTDPFFYFAFQGLALAIGGLLVFCYAIPNLLMDREFRFTLTEERMECTSPAGAFGESYSIAIDEVVGLEKEPWGDSSDWYVITRDNRRIKITPDYGNPVRKIVRTLQELNPALPVKQQ